MYLRSLKFEHFRRGEYSPTPPALDTSIEKSEFINENPLRILEMAINKIIEANVLTDKTTSHISSHGHTNTNTYENQVPQAAIQNEERNYNRNNI